MTAESGADAQDSEDTAKGAAKAETETSSAATTESESASASAESDDSAAESVEIPKQQSAEEAADSEAGEGARK
ncbi:gliding motility protein [Streptomyces umbrinus]|uniref:gliding motility protein n=1 Tax=Streptomyces umbrinus TaxID=67370 RepID=UPI003C2FB86A